ncbi:MAG: hypothetical protein VX185_17365 [Pseudomonadota bacterium]|nr:hypothetical protein [Pseudomonadota bacterium]|tara:strand:+ start:363 stop:536 length:174 start_codon:yes stop_codon:yes gene_type:complete
MNKRILTMAGLILAGAFAAGCQNDNSFEQAGETMDESMNDMSNATEDAAEDVTNQNY